MPTIKQFLEKAGDLQLDAEVTLAKALAKDRSFLAAHPEENVPGQAVTLFQKRKNGMPLAYVLGEKEFYGRKFEVNRHVLIPRPETETVVEMALARISNTTLGDGQFITVVDVGTGSGVIAATIDLEAKKPVNVIGLDLSSEALAMAEKNCNQLGARVKLLKSNLLEAFSEGIQNTGETILVANLPYVSKNWDWISKELKYEPEMALFTDENGLKVIFDFLEQVDNKVDEGFVYLEADPCQHETIRKKVEDLGMRFIRSQDFGIEIEI